MDNREVLTIFVVWHAAFKAACKVGKVITEQVLSQLDKKALLALWVGRWKSNQGTNERMWNMRSFV